MVVLGPGGERRVPVVDLHRLPGDRPDQDTVLGHGELITAVELPRHEVARWSTYLDEEDTVATPMGSRGIGEIGIVGTAAAVANATYHATGVRVRELPVTADRFL